MHPVVNHLVQLQELMLIRDEEKVTMGLARLEQMDASIKDMTDKLPQETKVLFEKLHKRDHVVIVPVSNGICAACGMKLPISLVQAVRLGREIHGCPNCAKMLFYPESAPRWVGKAPRRSEPRKVGISRFSSHTLMIPKLEAEDTEGVIRELAYKMEHEGFVDKADKLVESALRREAILSTAVDHGLAFPHVRNVEGGGLTLALGITAKPIKWTPSGEPITRIIFFTAIPTAASAFYLKLLSGLMETLMKPDARKALLAEKEADKLWKTLCKVTRTTIK
jgi:mannitol/fructose-specific phosphotransferase system IIA component (Ntr-type)